MSGPARAPRRSARAHDAVLAAAVALLEEGGLAHATVDAISTRSGVSKATIYKHWPNRTAVAAEAFGRRMAGAAALPDTGSARGDLTEQVRRTSEFLASGAGRVFGQLLAATVGDPGAAAYLRDHFLTGRRAASAELWGRAMARGEVRESVDAETATDLLLGPLVYRLVGGHAPLTGTDADAVADAALNGLLATP
ncbi:TetR/AcrR family transcriptional regulator [Actinomadura sp. DC4]|uniref:TetR/AcrR family transcriptional regulator n=1 Tax=Actinomadura sp. DC4 TaxID=3055069 RepID=UPI0025B0774E|nr:TetR/AcrR family transcriptional regulator [Actinomadura sp. DC4]MDN3353794.1 TetR/AcrR family transcriptional regulator C-terminal ligand-binding domain-containing protein [Actinomadura sp. DC4]